MTKEELEKEAEEWIKEHSGLIGSYMFVKYDYDSMQKSYLAAAESREKRIAELEKEFQTVKQNKHTVTHLGECVEKIQDEKIAELELKIKHLTQHLEPQTMTALFEQVEEEVKLEKENAELKARIGLSIDCEKAQKDGELCLGYGGDEDEPCERCKNCIKCECGYYQLGETEKDEQFTKVKELLKWALHSDPEHDEDFEKKWEEAEQFLSEVEK